MAKIVTECPACGTKLTISALHCSGCGMELRNDFPLSPFDSLNMEQYEFLISFLKHKGNMRSLQDEMGISYQLSKKKLDSLLSALGLADNKPETEKEEVIEMSNWLEKKDDIKASDIIRQKIMENGGRAVVYTAQGLPCEIWANPDDVSFSSNKLPKHFRYEVFDVIVELLVSQGGRARKGNARNCRLGDTKCDETSVAGAIGYHYFHAEMGDAIYDPVFVLAAVLEWAGIATNGRGELILTSSYRELCRSNL